ncbi:hypothetical protein Fmac_027131 [Flemingia macrophylla]|uniref:Disease resistance protein RPM1 n=1 Tax=Flemingia macrophylla TaxID=520843 RepID=A0ABD1LGU0_9FABA
MAETAVSLAGQHLLPTILEAVNMLKDLPNEVADFTDELEKFQAFINGADKVAEAEEDGHRRDRIKKRVMRLREASFRMEDIIDKYYMICEEKQPDDLGCAALTCEAVEFIKTLIHRIQIAYQIQDVKSIVRKERDGFNRVFPVEEIPNNSRGDKHVSWDRHRMAPLFTEEDKVVGFDGPKDQLKEWLIKGKFELTVICVVGMGGQGKTTLAKMVFGSNEVFQSFDCRAWITVSQSYTVEGLLGDLLQKFGLDVSTEMNRQSKIEKVRDHLLHKRYVILFDDVWDKKFWNEIDLALFDNKNGSRIVITTRNEEVVEFCKKFSSTQVHKLEPLSEEESLRLFCKKAFQYGSDGRCPDELKDISLEIVRKCKGLPLAIVIIGGLLFQKDESAVEWRLCTQSLSVALERNSDFSIGKILSLSYDDLPDNLKSCLLYFGMYPEDCEVKSNRLTRQWIAEGFVKREEGKTLEEVAQQYLVKLILRNLVQVCSFTIDGKPKRCRVHDLLHETILRKMKDTGFGLYIGEHNESISSGVVRHLKIAAGSEDLFGRIEGSYVRSIQIIWTKKLSEHLVRNIPTKCMLLRALQFESTYLTYAPKNLGNLIYLKYLSFRGGMGIIPKSIGNLQNLETLEATKSVYIDMPKEITKLRKLRHLLVDGPLTEVIDSLGDMTSLEQLYTLMIGNDEVVIRELAKLNKLRDLRLFYFRTEHGRTLGSSINKMQFLEKLHIRAVNYKIVIDLHNVSPKSTLRKLLLSGRLEKFPNWILELQNLVKLTLSFSHLTDDPLKSLKGMPNLMLLCMRRSAYEGESLHFEDGGFQKLKKLRLEYLHNLKSIIIREGALCSLERLELCGLSNLKGVPSGIHYLEKLRVAITEKVPRKIQDRLYAYMENKSGGSSSNCKIAEM